MTRDEVLAMKPGRELDALVAEKVFGRNDYDWDDTHWYCPTCKAWVHPAQVTYYEVHERCHTPVVSDWCDTDGKVMPNYSTDISAAWEVAEQLQKQGYAVCIELLPYEETSVGVYEADPANQIAYAKSNKPAEAIAKAALLAVMDGEDENND